MLWLVIWSKIVWQIALIYYIIMQEYTSYSKFKDSIVIPKSSLKSTLQNSKTLKVSDMFKSPKSNIRSRLKTQNATKDRSRSQLQQSTDLKTILPTVVAKRFSTVQTIESQSYIKSKQCQFYLNSIIKQQQALFNIISSLRKKSNNLTNCRLYLLLKIKQQGKYTTMDPKLECIRKMSEIYCAIAVLIYVIAKQSQLKWADQETESVLKIIQNEHTLLLYILDTINQEMRTHKILTDKICEIIHILTARQYKFELNRKTHMITNTYKLRQVLTKLIKTDSKLLGVFLIHLQHFYNNSAANIISQITTTNSQILSGSFDFSETQQLRDKINPLEYTLFLDLDETLVHYVQFNNQLLVRPYVYMFLKELSAFYQLIIFTAASQHYADWAIDQIDPGHFISKRLYRNHTTFKDSNYLKDIEKIRPLSKSIIVDNLNQNFSCNQENGILIRTWVGDKKDRVLRELCSVLKLLVKHNGKDIRNSIKEVKQQQTYSLLRNGFCFGNG